MTGHEYGPNRTEDHRHNVTILTQEPFPNERLVAVHPDIERQRASLNQHAHARNRDTALNANDITAWKTRAQTVIAELAATGDDFTADTLVSRVGLPRGITGQNANNALGGLFSSASKRGLIQSVGFTNSARGTRRDGKHTIWRGTHSG